MPVPVEEAPANFVRTTAARRIGTAILGITGRKGHGGAAPNPPGNSSPPPGDLLHLGPDPYPHTPRVINPSQFFATLFLAAQPLLSSPQAEHEPQAPHKTTMEPPHSYPPPPQPLVTLVTSSNSCYRCALMVFVVFWHIVGLCLVCR